MFSRRRPGGLLFFPALVFWSAALWFFFEAVNFRIANWYYIYVTDGPWEQAVSSILAFGTVLPALFLIEAVLERAGVFKEAACRPLRLGRSGGPVLVAAGVLCMILPMAWPRLFFALVWGGMALLLAPLNAKRLDSPLLGELEAGRSGRLLRILLAGLICGLVWEFLNSFARIRWIYSVPFLEDIKLFEMPPLGFLGFPPFAVECVVIYGFLVGFGLAPAAERIKRGRQARPLPRLPAAAAWLLAAAGMWLALQGLLRFNVDSRTPRLDGLGLPAPVASFARDCGMDDAFELDPALRDPWVRELLAKEGADVEEAAGLTGLAVFRGIGTRHARALFRLGVKKVDDLRGRDPADLARRLTAEEGGTRPVSVSRVKVWIKAAELSGRAP